MVEGTLAAAAGWSWDMASVGIPTPVRGSKPVSEPANLGDGWVGFDFEQAFGRPTKVVNDAVMQALGSYEGGRMLFLGLGTGLGSALIIDGVVEPLELAHLPFRKGTFEDYVGERSLERRGRRNGASSCSMGSQSPRSQRTSLTSDSARRGSKRPNGLRPGATGS